MSKQTERELKDIKRRFARVASHVSAAPTEEAGCDVMAHGCVFTGWLGMSHELGSLTPPAVTMRGDETRSRSSGQCSSGCGKGASKCAKQEQFQEAQEKSPKRL